MPNIGKFPSSNPDYWREVESDSPSNGNPIQRTTDDIKNSINENTKELINSKGDHDGFTQPTEPVDYKKTIDELKQEGILEIEELQNKINNIQNIHELSELVDLDKIKVRENSYNNNCISPDQSLSDEIEYVLKDILGAKQEIRDDVGEDIDVESAIEYVINKNDSRIFNSEEVNIGMSIIISIDNSGSMDGRVNEIALITCASILNAIKDIKNVELQVQKWSGFRSGDVTISVANNIEELNKLEDPDGSTPLGHGIAYATNSIMKMRYAQKLMFVLTDGAPNIGSDTSNNAIEFASSQVFSAHQLGITVFGLGIGYDMINNKNMQLIFGDTWQGFNSIEDATRTLRDRLIHEIGVSM